MGCTSSTESTAINNAAPPTKNSGTHESVENKQKREKKITAGTEAMVAISTDSDHYTDSKASSAVVGNLSIRYACLSRRGRDPDHSSKPNQDCYGDHESFCSVGNANSAFFAVYDGHGPHGEECSHFVRRRLPHLLKKNIKQQGTDIGLSIHDVQASLHDAHVECNGELRQSQINDSHSGTTSVGVYIYDDHITVCNVGDSRAVLCTKSKTNSTGSGVQAVPLSKDHTPYRRDEAARCIRSGARILSFGQIDPSTKDDDEDSEVEDPPRVWAKDGKYPGTAFTRSLGDSVAERFGVCAEPEMVTLNILPQDHKVIVLASDGVFDVMSNQEVVDICFQHRDDPTQACSAIIEKSHEEWLLNDDCDEESANYDDMTVICIFFDYVGDEGVAEPASPTVGATSTSTNVDSQLPQSTPQPQAHRHAKRVRQKTLRNLEEMEEEE